MNDRANLPGLSWTSIVRLGLVQASLGAIVVLVTCTLNRVMVVELSLPAILPGVLVALHYGVQVLRPRLGFGSDMGGRRTPWIIGGMALLAAGGVAASGATALMVGHRMLGIALAVPAYAAVGIGVGAAGTSLLVLMAKQVAPRRRAPAATILWLLMIFGIAISATIAGKLLEPFSVLRLVVVTTKISGAAFILAVLAVWGIERVEATAPAAAHDGPTFFAALREIWGEAQARRFAIFVFVSMLAYSAQELILEPFAGAVFRMTPGQTAQLTGAQHGGVMLGMLLVAIGGGLAGDRGGRTMRYATICGCAASAAALFALAVGGLLAPAWPLRTSVFILGAANGAFAVAAIGSMMGLASQGRGQREGVRMGLWGAAQALAFGAGGILGTGASDVFRSAFGAPAPAYAAVFFVEALLFVIAARLAASVFQGRASSATEQSTSRGLAAATQGALA
jgi:BCD family chlorophyll transporter-like MFS transporter